MHSLRVAMLAPPWIPIPPPGYGGTEQVVDLLTAGLIDRGHEVTLFAAPGTESPAAVQPLLECAHPDEIQTSVHEADHVACAFAEIDRAEGEGAPYDIVHDHSGFVAFAFADRLDAPLVHTVHGPFSDDTRAFYTRHGSKAPVVALTRFQADQAPDEVRVIDVVPNPIVVGHWPLRTDKDEYLLWIGRFNDDKGPQRAIAAARGAGRPLVLAGPVQPGQEEFFAGEVEPHLDGDAVRWVGEVGGREKADLFAGAAALLMPIRWPEPFGLVMTEAMACGTPVIAFPEGSVPEIVEDGITGFVVGDEDEMAGAIGRLGEIDPDACRDSACDRFDVAPVAEGYERAYLRAVDQPRAAAR